MIHQVKPRIIALIPMKGESERIPNKNMRDFAGQPLCSVLLDKLVSSKIIDKIVVNTDSDRIKNFLIKRYDQINIIDRPKGLIGNDVSMNKIIDYDMNQTSADIYIQTHSTNPLLSIQTIEDAIDKWIKKKKDFDSLFSVNKYQTRFYDQNGVALNHDPGLLLKTQDLSPLYEENSCLYIFTKESFKKKNRRIGETPLMFEIDSVESTDIDVEDQFILAEKLFKIL